MSLLLISIWKDIVIIPLFTYLSFISFKHIYKSCFQVFICYVCHLCPFKSSFKGQLSSSTFRNTTLFPLPLPAYSFFTIQFRCPFLSCSSGSHTFPLHHGLYHSSIMFILLFVYITSPRRQGLCFNSLCYSVWHESICWMDKP